MEYQIVIRVDSLNFESDVLTVEAEDWEDVVNQIFGNIEVVDTNE